MKTAPKKAIPGSGKTGPLVPAGTDIGDEALHCGFCRRTSKVVALWGTINEETAEWTGYVCEDCKS